MTEVEWDRYPIVAADEKARAWLQIHGDLGRAHNTVDAYGLPVDELKRGLDYWWLGLSFPDQDLSPIVKRACHALSLDDERRTFHPVLWNEAFESELIKKGKVSPDRLKQVWFAGMHSNVGGGYAKDGLSYVPLRWIVHEATAVKLKVHGAALAGGDDCEFTGEIFEG